MPGRGEGGGGRTQGVKQKAAGQTHGTSFAPGHFLLSRGGTSLKTTTFLLPSFFPFSDASDSHLILSEEGLQSNAQRRRHRKQGQVPHTYLLTYL